MAGDDGSISHRDSYREACVPPLLGLVSSFCLRRHLCNSQGRNLNRTVTLCNKTFSPPSLAPLGYSISRDAQQRREKKKKSSPIILRPGGHADTRKRAGQDATSRDEKHSWCNARGSPWEDMWIPQSRSVRTPGLYYCFASRLLPFRRPTKNGPRRPLASATLCQGCEAFLPRLDVR